MGRVDGLRVGTRVGNIEGRTVGERVAGLKLEGPLVDGALVGEIVVGFLVGDIDEATTIPLWDRSNNNKNIAKTLLILVGR